MILIRTFLLLVLLTSSAWAAPTIDNAVSNSGSDVTSITISGFDVGGSDKLLTSCLVKQSEAASPVTAHHFNTTEDMTLVVSADHTDDRATKMYYLINPTTGAHDLVATFADVVTGSLGAISFNGVHQTVPLGTAVKHEGLLTDEATVTVDSAADEIVVDCWGFENASPATDGASQTEQWEEATFNANGTTEPGAAPTVVMNRTWSGSNKQSGLIGVSVKPVAGGGGASAAKRVIIIQ